MQKILLFKSLEEKTNFTRDTQINFFDSNQMMKLIKFMIEHEMGSEAFNEYYPPGKQRFLDGMILEDITEVLIHMVVNLVK